MIDRLGSKQKAWIYIYEQVFHEFEDFYTNYFQTAFRQFTTGYFQQKAFNLKLQSEIWNPNRVEPIEKDDDDWFYPNWVGQKIERYGNLYGYYVHIYKTPFESLSLAPSYKFAEYHVLKVKKDILVVEQIMVPAFGQPGGGRRYYLCEPISELMRKGAVELIL